MSLETIPSLVSVSPIEANVPIDNTEPPDPLVPATAETEDMDSASTEADFAEACGFIWPESHLKQALIDARLSQLAILWQKSSDRRDREYASIERDILLVFEKKRHLNMIEDICLPVERHLGITPVGTVDEFRRKHESSNQDSAISDQSTVEGLSLSAEEYLVTTPADALDEAMTEDKPNIFDSVVIDQATIADCHNLVVTICRNLEEILGNEGLKSSTNPGPEPQAEA